TVRSAAAGALRSLSGPDVDGLLSQTIVNDRDEEVRASAIFAAGFRRPISTKLTEALTHAAKTDSAEHVRVAAITLLQQNAQVVPDLAQTLAWVAEHDEKPAVRRLAQEALKK
ncbi:MAG TPA: HEAT repeat domain-containing protein, partial [Bryobacteraceae bacterium]|nr:HEAT repeat domain-containing protein [Bryobacteraceae bacterium]